MAIRASAPSVPQAGHGIHPLAAASGDLLDIVRADAPLVQCITNTVVTNFTANALLALGASPAMCDIPGEAGPFAHIAGGLLVNLGTPTAEQRAASIEAAAAANEAGVPWVLDPVAVGTLPVRTQLAHELLAMGPDVVRGNPSEILAIAGEGAGGRGVDSTAGSEAALDAACRLARENGSIVAVSGATDIVTDGNHVVRLDNGHVWLTKVTGGGCALGAVMAAFASTSDDRLTAVVAAATAYTVAAEQAAAAASGPGSFAVAFLDRLHAVSADEARAAAVIS